jgi:hypothetical protein
VQASETGLSVRASRVSLAEVLRAISTETGIDVRGELRSDPDVDVAFGELPFSEAFRRLLGGQSFLLLYGEGARPVAVELVGSGPAAEALVAAAPPAARVARGDGPADDSVSPNAPPMPGSERRHPIEGRLARALRAPDGSFNDLIALAARTEDGGLRKEALRRTLGILEAEPELKVSLLATVERSSDDQLAKYLIWAAGPRAEVVASALAEVVAGEARGRADKVVRQIRLIQAP